MTRPMATQRIDRVLITSLRPRLSLTSAINVMYILLFSCSSVDSNHSMDCFSERFNDSVAVLDVSINGQEELDNFIDNVTSLTVDDKNRCIQLLLNELSYKLDVIKVMSVVKLGTGGGFVLVGVAKPWVTINCVANSSELEELRSNLKPIANVSLVVLDGLKFTGCPVPIVIEEVSTVIVQNCDFIDHEHGALNIFNSPNVTVKYCTFRNNTSSSYFTRKPFQGNSGGLSIAYNMQLATRLSGVNVLVTDCSFINNSADPPSHLFFSTTSLIEREIFSGRGGGMAMPINVECEVNVVINNSVFINNFAGNYGGGLYCFISGTAVGNQTYMFGNNKFVDNEAMIGSGALNFGNFGNTAPFSELHSTMYNCTFEKNRAQTGGCLHMFPSYPGFKGNYITIKDCVFVNNTSTEIGGAIDVTSYNFYESRQHYDPVEFIGCKFDGNFGGRGATIDFSFHNGRFENVSFNRNRGPVIRAIGAAVEFAGSISFTNNNAKGFDGGALYMLTSSQITMNTGANLEFINNTGGLGASVVVVTGTVLPVFARNYYNPLCFIQYPHPEVPPIEWEQVSIKFAGNRAIIGSAIYANILDLCSWYSFEPPYFYANRSNVLRWPFVSYGDEFNLNNNSGHNEKDSSNQLLAVQTPVANFMVNTKTIAAYPGETIQVFVSPYDEQDYLTSENFRILERSNTEDVTFAFNPTAQTINPSGLTLAVKYSMKGAAEITNNMLSNNYTIEVSSLKSHSSAALIQDDVNKFNLTIKPCPPGHALQVADSEDEYECRCDDNNVNIVECVPNDNKVLLEEGLWAHYVNNGSVDSKLEFYRCPTGYCQCTSLDESSESCSSVYSYRDENSQCVCDREGLLCGRCRGDKGVSVLLNNCKSCGPINLLLILFLVVADVILIIGILVASVTIPLWLFPILFYLQVTPIVAQYFPAPFAIAQPYLHYITSAFSLYFPYDFCLYPGMPALVSYSFRYIPILLSIIISAILYTANRKYKIAANMRLSWSGLWLLILLLYTDVLNTSLSILNCPILTDSSGRKNLRWYVDGTVKCFTGEHIPLAISAICAVLACVFMILLITAIVMRKIKKHWAFSMSVILKAPFIDRFYWWAPVDLLRKLLFVFLITILPGNLAPVLLLTMVYVAVFAYLKPYRSSYINVLEVFTLVDIMLQLTIASTHRLKAPIFKSENDLRNLTDGCGKVDKLNEHATILTFFYYLPLLIFLLLIIKVFSTKVYTKWYQYHENKTVAVDDSTTARLISSTEPVITTYMEFDEHDEYFKMTSGSHERESHL